MTKKFTCPQHKWISTKLENYVQCLYCGERKEIEDAVLVEGFTETMTPQEEYQEAQ